MTITERMYAEARRQHRAARAAGLIVATRRAERTVDQHADDALAVVTSTTPAAVLPLRRGGAQ